jgi:predicted negative regulator of RcsB-dependent stress response
MLNFLEVTELMGNHALDFIIQHNGVLTALAVLVFVVGWLSWRYYR